MLMTMQWMSASQTLPATAMSMNTVQRAFQERLVTLSNAMPCSLAENWARHD